jgi:hypothetical protein
LPRLANAGGEVQQVAVAGHVTLHILAAPPFPVPLFLELSIMD